MLSAGWVWQPEDILTVFSVQQAIKKPEYLDSRGVNFLPTIRYIVSVLEDLPD